MNAPLWKLYPIIKVRPVPFSRLVYWQNSSTDTQIRFGAIKLFSDVLQQSNALTDLPGYAGCLRVDA
jgi:hypothetical protein